MRYNENGEFQTFSTADGLPSDEVFLILKDSGGKILIYTRKGIARFDGFRFETTRGGEDFNADAFRPYFSPFGTYWELTGKSLTAEKNGKKTEYEIPENLKKIINSESFALFYLVRMLETAEGELWITVGKYIFKLQTGEIKQIPEKQTPQAGITVIAHAKNGDVWFGTAESGACRFTQNRFTCFGSKNGLSSDYVRDILLDREGSLWISTNEKGFCRLSEQIITSFSTDQGLAGKNAYSVLETADGAVWIGSFGSLARYNDGETTNYRSADGLLYESVQSLFEDLDGTLWIGVSGRSSIF